MKPLHAIGSLTVASIIMFAAGAKAANYSFINAAGGSAADSANWQNSSVPADSMVSYPPAAMQTGIRAWSC